LFGSGEVFIVFPGDPLVFARPPLLHLAVTPFIVREIGPSPRHSIFIVLSAIFLCCIFIFFFSPFSNSSLLPDRQSSLFFSRFRILFYRPAFDEPSQTARRRRCRRGQSIAASSDKRVRSYRCLPVVFSRSIIPAGRPEI